MWVQPLEREGAGALPTCQLLGKCKCRETNCLRVPGNNREWGGYQNQTEFKQCGFAPLAAGGTPRTVRDCLRVVEFLPPPLPCCQSGNWDTQTWRSYRKVGWGGRSRPRCEPGFTARRGGWRKVAVQSPSRCWGFPIYVLMRWEMENLTTFVGSGAFNYFHRPSRVVSALGNWNLK